MIKFSLFVFIALFFSASCCKNDDLVVEPSLNVIELRSAGKEMPGNITCNILNCKPEGAEQTLRSIRYVEPLPIYYMDYYAEVDWKSLEKSPSERYRVNDFVSVTSDINNLLYVNAPTPNPNAELHGGCSGFVCFNPEGELLFARNYDGDVEPLAIVFNKAVNPQIMNDKGRDMVFALVGNVKKEGFHSETLRSFRMRLLKSNRI